MASRTRIELEETVRLAGTREDGGAALPAGREVPAYAGGEGHERGRPAGGIRHAGQGWPVVRVQAGGRRQDQEQQRGRDDGGASRMMRVCDVTNESQVDAMVRDVARGAGRGGMIDALINNAG